MALLFRVLGSDQVDRAELLLLAYHLLMEGEFEAALLQYLKAAALVRV